MINTQTAVTLVKAYFEGGNAQGMNSQELKRIIEVIREAAEGEEKKEN